MMLFVVIRQNVGGREKEANEQRSTSTAVITHGGER